MHSDHSSAESASPQYFHNDPRFDPAAAGTPPACHDLRQIHRQNYRQV
jgi:hypothetical protein